jgi:hypothetical protein
LDSSLIAAFLSERDQGTLTKKQLRKLRRILTQLAAGADIDEQFINDSLSPPSTNVDGSSLGSRAVDRNDETPSVSSTVTDPTSSLASPRSTSSTASLSTPLGFLRAAFPEVPSSSLERVITNASNDGEFVDGVDIERAVQLLLGEEYPPGLGEDSNMPDALDNDSSLAPRSERPVVNPKGKKKKGKLKTVLVNDIRQRPHVCDNPESRHGTRSVITQRSSDVDIWTSVSSLSVQLAALLPRHPESFFKSFFHSPESKTPATAVRRALTAITSAGDDDVSSLDMAVLLNLQDILRSTSEYNELNADERQRLLSDAHLCLHAVGSRVDNALDLVWLLQGLDADDAAGWKTAPYHQEPLPRQDGLYLETSGNTQFDISVLRSGRPPGRPPSPSQTEWSTVTSRKRSTAASLNGVAIPLSNGRYGTSSKEIGLTRDEDPATLKERRDDLESRLRETSMLAAKAWKGGNSKNVGRHIAHYHVEEVRASICQCFVCALKLDVIYSSRCADYRKNSRTRIWISQGPVSTQQS